MRLKLSELIPSESRDLQGRASEATDVAAETSAKDQVIHLLHTNLGPRLMNPDLGERELGQMVSDELNRIVSDLALPLTGTERAQLITSVTDYALRLGPLEELLNDETVTEIMVNAHDQVWIERAGKLQLSQTVFESELALRKTIERVVSRVGRRIDESSPYVDARLPDGSRINAVLPPISLTGPSLTIRKFPSNPLGMNDLIAKGALNRTVADFLSACVRGRLNILVSGGTGAGKTTLLNILSNFIPDTERVVSIEDAAELQLHQPNLVRLESRPPNVEGKGAIPIRDLVSNSLRMRPDRIVVGEVRGGEALDMLQAMNTGHDGSLSTIHANTARDALARLETLVLMAGTDLPSRAIREQIASAINLIIHQDRLSDGTRKIVTISEVVGMDHGAILTQDIFTFEHAGVNARGQVLGLIKPTGVRPLFTEKLAEDGITLPATMFGG